MVGGDFFTGVPTILAPATVHRMEHDSDLLTVTAFAREAGAHPHTVSNYERRGDLKATRASNGIRLFRRSDIPKLRQLIAEGIARRPRKAKP
jgi:hypothetical protein